MPAVGGQIISFFDNEEGERYVNLIDLVCWCHFVATRLKAEGHDAEAEGVAMVGNAMADQLEPECS